MAGRDRTVDLIKTVAIWNVILSHVAAAPFSGGTAGTGQWLAALFWASLTHSSVSLFLMASGVLLLPPERELTVKRIYTRYLIARHADRRLLEYILVLWFVLGISYPTVRTVWPFTLLGGIPVQWRMNMTYASIGYTLLGYYLTTYHPCPRRSVCALSLLAGFLMVFGGTWAASGRQRVLYF